MLPSDNAGFGDAGCASPAEDLFRADGQLWRAWIEDSAVWWGPLGGP